MNTAIIPIQMSLKKSQLLYNCTYILLTSKPRSDILLDFIRLKLNGNQT